MTILASKIFDSRDVIARIEELQEDTKLINSEEEEELFDLLNLQDECQHSPDWNYGETIIREDYFTEYIKELIDDCYSIPPELTSGDWPWRHFQLDYEAAAEEAKLDYIECGVADYNYFIRG